MPPVVTPETREPSRHVATGQELAQLPLDEAWQPLAATAKAGLGEEGFEVLAHHCCSLRAGADQRRGVSLLAPNVVKLRVSVVTGAPFGGA